MGASVPKIIHIPTDLLRKVFPKTAEWTAENFQYNNIFDNRNARNDLDFRYTTKWIDGVQRVISWLDVHNQIEDSDRHPFYERVISAWERLGEDMGKELSDLS